MIGELYRAASATAPLTGGAVQDPGIDP